MAGLVTLVVQRRWIETVHYAAAVTIIMLPWYSWVTTNNADLALTDAYYSASPYGSWNIITSYSWSEKFIILGMNMLYAVLAFGQLWGFGPQSPLGIVVGVICAALVVRGVWRSRRHPIGIALFFYGAMLMGWVWPPLRFLLPTIPLLIWAGVQGVGRAKWVGVVVLTTLCLSGTWQLRNLSHEVRATGSPWPVAGYGDDWMKVSELHAWVLRETPADAVLTGNIDPAHYLFTGRKAVRAFSPDAFLLYYNVAGKLSNPLGTVEQFVQRLIRMEADYLIMTPGYGYAESPHLQALVGESLAKIPGGLQPVFGEPGVGYLVYRVNLDRLGAGLVR